MEPYFPGPSRSGNCEIWMKKTSDWDGTIDRNPRDFFRNHGDGCEEEHGVWANYNYNDVSRRLVTLNGGLIRELPQNPRKIQV